MFYKSEEATLCDMNLTNMDTFFMIARSIKSLIFFRWGVCVLQVIVEKVSGSQIVDIDKRKYLVPSDITVAQFMWIIRKRIQLPSEKAIFLFVDKTVPQSR